MNKLLDNLDLTEYFLSAILWAINILPAAILVFGFWISVRAYKAKIGIPFSHRKVVLVNED